MSLRCYRSGALQHFLSVKHSSSLNLTQSHHLRVPGRHSALVVLQSYWALGCNLQRKSEIYSPATRSALRRAETLNLFFTGELEKSGLKTYRASGRTIRDMSDLAHDSTTHCVLDAERRRLGPHALIAKSLDQDLGAWKALTWDSWPVSGDPRKPDHDNPLACSASLNSFRRALCSAYHHGMLRLSAASA